MATADGIDTQAIVGKYVSRQTTGVRLNEDSDTSAENQAVLESIAIAILLNPQAVLSIILRAKNSLQQLIAADMEIIDYITAAILETQNSDAFPESTADLVDAQTALVELDRIGRIDTNLQAFTRYQNSINNFLNNQLAPLLKRSQNGTFNRSGTEAKQDLFNGVGLFTQTHALLAQRLALLQGSVSDFNSVDLSKVVHTQTIARVRTSLSQIKVGMDTGGMSNTVAALELLAGTASLQSISNSRAIFDPTLQSKVFPVGNSYVIGPEPTAAFEDAFPGTLLTTTDLLNWPITLTVDGVGPISAELPRSTRSLCPFVINSIKTLNPTVTFNIPASYRLYVAVTPGSAPGTDGITHYSIPLTAGPARTQAQVMADITAGFAGTGPSVADFDNALGYMILAGDVADTAIRVLDSGPGSFNTGTGIFTPDPPSAHAILGFQAAASTPKGSFDIGFLQLWFTTMYPSVTAEILNSGSGPLRVSSKTKDPSTSTIAFSGQVPSDFGFLTGAGPAYTPVTVKAVPKALLVTDGTGAVQDPLGLGLLPGSVVHANAFIQPIDHFDGLRILFDPITLLPLTSSTVTVFAPTVVAVQQTIAALGLLGGSFGADILPLQGLLSPLLTTPSLAQVNDAIKAFAGIKSKLTTLLNALIAIMVGEAQDPADATAEKILSSLEERGFDRAQDLISQCQFSAFFGLTPEDVSKSTRLMKSMETVVTTDLPTSTVEELSPDGNALQASASASVLTDKEVP
jgi:hypothetical protein